MTILTEAPAGADVLDLAAAHAARAEARAQAGDPKRYVHLSVGYVEIVPEITVASAVYLQQENLVAGLGGLLADPADVDALLKELTTEDVDTLVNFISGTTVGESGASPTL